MKNFKLLLSAICWGLLLTFSSCGKYEEGPGLSLIPKEVRLEELWKLEKYSREGIDKTDSAFHYLGYNYQLRFSDVNDGDYTEYLQECAGCSDQLSWTGKWRFENDKEEILLQPNGREYGDRRFKILRLTQNDLYLECTNSNGIKERFEFSNVLEQSEIDEEKEKDKDKNKWE
ncbi:MAG: hypothetical protein IM638_14500 [Bacteroidetes bacterium]|nr:hypothetical protein [Bacteroidota bacterium]